MDFYSVSYEVIVDCGLWIVDCGIQNPKSTIQNSSVDLGIQFVKFEFTAAHSG